MDHLKAIEGLLTFHHGEIERLETARRVILEIDRRVEERIAAKHDTKHRGDSGLKKRTFVKKGNSHHHVPMLDSSAIRERVIALLATEPALDSGVIMAKIGMAGSKQAKHRVYTALSELKKKGVLAYDDGDRVYSLAVAA